MKSRDLTRRDFSKLTLAAFGGVVAGAGLSACDKGGGGGTTGGGTTGGGTNGGGATAATHDPALLTQEPHVCRGLNTCMNKGASGENACAGQGSCATAEAHACAGQNKCKGQGGCGDYPGQNACEGKGKCAVPIAADHGATWDKARKAFEEQMKAAGKEVGAAPAAG